MYKYKGVELNGCFEKPYRMSVDYNLKYMPYGQCGVDVNHDTYFLYSYTSCILIYDVKSQLLEFTSIAPNYSMTTIKHVNAFLKEYLPHINYKDVKSAYLNGEMSMKV